jgi:DNA repair photolyase
LPRPISNPPNPWLSEHVEWIGEPPPVEIRVHEERAKSILATNDSPDVPFRWSVNPYRGCQHACAYCYARAGHQHLGFGAGTDFDSQIVVKRNAPELLARALARKSWRGDWIAFSGVTDCYQPLEASYGLTRECLEVCLDHKNRVGVITKSALIRRDVGLLAKLHERAGVQVHLSIPFADEKQCRALEPFAASPRTRFETVRALTEAGIPVGVALAPVIPGLNDPQIPEILEAAREAGATSAFLLLLRLAAEVRPVFEERLSTAFPDRAGKVMHSLEESRAGMSRAQRGEFGARMKGSGPRWAAIEDLFRLHCRRLGLDMTREATLDVLAPEQGPRLRQGELFG